MREQVDVLIIGSGAGGAVTALELAEGGRDVVVLEEGAAVDPAHYGKKSHEAMRHFYRRRGMTPIVGRSPIGYVEGSCVGGSTEINSGFWHRTPREILLRWQAQYGLVDASPEHLAPHFDWAEKMTGVSLYPDQWPKSTEVFARGIEAMGWSSSEVPRTAPGCRSTNACASGCPTGAKQGMSRNVIPRAKAAGVRVVTHCRVRYLLCHRGRVTGVLASLGREDGTREQVRIDAKNVFVCCGPTESPALLRRSGIKYHVGDQLRIHPMLKVVAHFDEVIDAAHSVLPLIQVKEFAPEISLGGAFFTPGHLALTLSENWPQMSQHMRDHRKMATYYVAVRGTGHGTVRPSFLEPETTVVRYEITRDDQRNLSIGLARLCTLLLAAGAKAVYPSIYGLPEIRSEVEAIRWLDDRVALSSLAISTVHAFSACPMGERIDRCAVDSFGRVVRFENLWVNDASILPDSPGVNPQGSVMAFARRNAQYFLQESGR